MSEAKNRERGLRAALNNPRVSEEAKKHDRELLEKEFGEHFEESKTPEKARRASHSKHQPKVTESAASGSQEAQPAARKGRRASSGDASLHQIGEEKERANVIRGLKAALKNPHVSEKAKEVDRKKLQELGENIE